MKYFYILLTLAFLASCGTASVTPTDSVETPSNEEVNEIVETTLDELDAELSELDTSDIGEGQKVEEDTTDTASEEVMEAKVVKLDAPYTNPAGPVDMTVEYTLDSAGNIETIEVSATTYDLTGFNEGIQQVVGMTLADAASYATGSSLTGPAFSAALKGAQ